MNKRLLLILLVALTFRVAYLILQGERVPVITDGGDSRWYLTYGYRLVTGDDFSNDNIPTAPFYLVFVGLYQVLFGPQAAITAIRLTQVVIGTVTCYVAYRIGRDVSDNESVGTLTGAVLASSPGFIMETWQITTETWYIFFITAGLSTYINGLRKQNLQSRRQALLTAVFFALATLTRAVALLFPLGLALHSVIVSNRSQLGQQLKRAVGIVTIYALMVSLWTIFNLIALHRLVIGAEGFAAFLYIGAAGWEGPFQTDENLAQELGITQLEMAPQSRQDAYTQAASNIIGRDPLGYVGRRIGELSAAYLQPHATEYLGGDSIKNMMSAWWQDDRSLGGLLGITREQFFWPKLTIYVFHYTGLLLGILGMWLTRKSWRLTLPLIGFILYTTLVHLVFLAIPRYLFPTQVFWWIFASVSLAALADRWRQWNVRPSLSESAVQATTKR